MCTVHPLFQTNPNIITDSTHRRKCIERYRCVHACIQGRIHECGDNAEMCTHHESMWSIVVLDCGATEGTMPPPRSALCLSQVAPFPYHSSMRVKETWVEGWVAGSSCQKMATGWANLQEARASNHLQSIANTARKQKTWWFQHVSRHFKPFQAISATGFWGETQMFLHLDLLSLQTLAVPAEITAK